MRPFVSFPCFFAELWSLNCPKKVHFMQFCVEFTQKPKSVKAIYRYGSESSYYSFSENDMVYRGLSQRSRDTSN